MDKSKSSKSVQREILLSFWKIHILHHAVKEPVVGNWMLRELQRHGYEVSPGTLYPMLRRMESLGWLRSETAEGSHAKAKRSYFATDHGREVLALVHRQIEELKAEFREYKGDENGK